MQLTFEGDTFAHLLSEIRRFLDSLPGDAATQGLLNLDGPLPPAVKRAPKEGPGAKPTPEQIAAAINAEAPPCTRGEVVASAEDYLAAFGQARLAERVGYPNINAIPATEYWRVKRDLDRCVKTATP